MKAALVISGGGSKGAFAGGVAEFLCEQEKDYAVFVGSSTGSLLVPFLAIGEIERLKKIYSNIRQKDVFSSNPFKLKKDKQGKYTVRINHFSVLSLFVRGTNTFGESKSLYHLIKKSYTETDYETLKMSGKSVIITVSNLTTNQVEYKKLETVAYHDAIDWMWASANVTPFMSLVCKNGFEYADGGFGNMAPIQKAIDEQCCDIDAIVLEHQEKKYHNRPSKNGFDLLIKVLGFSINQIIRNDISIGNLSAMHKRVRLQLYFPHKVLTYNSLIFDPQKMKEWWEEGYAYSKNITPKQIIVELNPKQ